MNIETGKLYKLNLNCDFKVITPNISKINFLKIRKDSILFCFLQQQKEFNVTILSFLYKNIIVEKKLYFTLFEHDKKLFEKL